MCFLLILIKLNIFSLARVTKIIGPKTINFWSYDGRKNSNEAYGLLVELKDEIFTPNKPKRYFEVYLYFMGNSCERVPYSEEKVKSPYKTGTEVRVIGKELDNFINEAGHGNIQLEASIFTLGHIYPNNFGDYPVTTSSSIFSYQDFNKTYHKLYKKLLDDYKANRQPVWELIQSLNSVAEFEYRKDLLRLEQEKSNEKKLNILKRLAFYKSHGGDIVFHRLVRNHISEAKTIQDLIEFRKRNFQ